jgi:hypothetical protein
MYINNSQYQATKQSIYYFSSQDFHFILFEYYIIQIEQG